VIARAEIFDLQGRKMLEQTFPPARQQIISIETLPAGVYMVKANSAVSRLVKN